MPSHTLEHTTYKYGGKQEDETSTATLADAQAIALQLLERHGGRIWIDGAEFSRKQLEQLIQVV